MKMRHVVEYLLVSLLAAGFSSARATSQQLNPKSAAAGPDSTKEKLKNGKRSPINEAPVVEEGTIYRIGVEDELQISVWHEPELSTTVVVRPDGKITIPLLNDVAVVGLRPDELQIALAGKLKPFVNEPQVTVIARNIRSRKVYLVGQANRQGTFPLNDSMTVLELIANAGGLNPFAKSGSIYVLRPQNGQKTRIPFNYKKALSGKGENITLMPGDVVVVP